MASFFPSVGSWYQELNASEIFKVVAIDEKGGTIEVQYEDGDITEFDSEYWRQADLIPAAAPEDANAGYQPGNFNAGDTGEYYEDSYINPLESIEPESFQGYDDLF